MLDFVHVHLQEYEKPYTGMNHLIWWSGNATVATISMSSLDLMRFALLRNNSQCKERALQFGEIRYFHFSASVFGRNEHETSRKTGENQGPR